MTESYLQSFFEAYGWGAFIKEHPSYEARSPKILEKIMLN